jgi:hypothetical protein
MKRIKNISIALLVAGLAIASSAVLAASYTLDGGATWVETGNASEGAIQLISDDTYAGSSVQFELDNTLTFAELTTLSADFNVTDDDCTNGSPRFSIGLNTASGIQYVFAYLGPEPNYQGCTANTWANSGNLLAAGTSIDTSQLGGTFYDTIENAVATYGGLTVAEVMLVTDAGYAFEDGEQTVLVDKVIINDTSFDFEGEDTETPVYTADDCKRNGWRDLTGENGEPGPFRNQGDCVSFFATNGRNLPNG